MNGHGAAWGREILAGMLGAVGIDREPVEVGQPGIGELPGEDLLVKSPTRVGGEHEFVNGAIRDWKVDTATGTTHWASRFFGVVIFEWFPTGLV